MQKKAPEISKPLPAEIDFGAYRIADPEEFGRNMLRLTEEAGKVMTGFLERSNGNGGPFSLASEATEAARLFTEIAQHWLADPGKVAETQAALARDYLQLAGATAQRMMGAEALPVAEPEPGDNRFNDPEWSRNPYFDFWKQAYLITTRWLEDVLDGPRASTSARASAPSSTSSSWQARCRPRISPSPIPSCCARRWRSSGRNLVQGMANLVHDMEKSGDILKHQPDRRRGLRGRPQRRHRAGQGRLPERSHPAHPVRALDRDRARDAAADRAAVDQQVLHPRSRAPEVLHPLHGRQGLHRVHRVLGQSRRAPQGQDLRGLHDRGPARRHQRGQARDGRREDQRHRLLRRRHAARHHARLSGGPRRGAVRLGHVLCRPGRLHQGRRPHAVHRRHPAQGAGGDDGRARLSSTARAWPPSSTCCGPRT